jgi:hypothetical protein
VIDILFKGVGWTDIALTLNRVAVGVFFMFSGYHKLFNAQRHRALVDELTALHVGALRINQMVGANGRFRRRQRGLRRPPYAPRRARPACDRPRRRRHVGASANQRLPADR